ncbi:MAG: hypothetical protein K9H64_05055 [Bacteroidales bacterium]|nr:hypothetical protein [Bacteroidales bacterium]MCF8455206.1 hypothetical protein [Bacteroidales bacterium]
MKIIVDVNIAFSAILNTSGKIGDLLLNSEGIIDFIAPDYMVYEVLKYHNKIQLITGKSLYEVERIHFRIFQKILLLGEEQISIGNWRKANEIVEDIDPKDTPYIAYSIEFGLKIWTGDKLLRKGLLEKGYDFTLTTDELLNIRNKLEYK